MNEIARCIVCGKHAWYMNKCQQHALAAAPKAPASPAQRPAPDPRAAGIIAGFIDKYRMPGSPTGAQVVAKLQERSNAHD